MSPRNLPSSLQNPGTPTTNNIAAPSTPSVYRQGSPGTPNRRPTSVRIESADQRNQRLAEEAREKEKARAKAEAEEKVKKEKEAARKEKEAEKRKRKEEEAVKEGLRKEEESKERARLKKEKNNQRLRKLTDESEARRQKALGKAQGKEKDAFTAAKSDVQDGKTVQSSEEGRLSPHFAVPVSPTSDGRPRLQRQKSKLVNLSVQGLVPANLTLENLDSTSDQIINWINNSDCRALFHVIRLILTQTTQEPARCEIYARLCRNMMERISPEIQDDRIKDNEGKSIAGGQLFRKYLLASCREDFEHVWVANDDSISVDIVKSMGDGKDEPIDERIPAKNWAPNLAGLGLIEFMTELFKLQMLPERFMYGCLEQLVEVGNPEEAGVEALCRLLTTCGSIQDKPKARAKFDACFARIRELTRSPNVSSRTKSLVQVR